MAIKSSLRLIARRISEAVKEASARQGLAPGDYALAGTFDEKTDRIYLRLGTDRTIDQDRWYADTLQEIRKSFPDFNQITLHINLVVRKVQNLDEIYWDYGDGESELDMTEMLEQAKRV